LDRSDQLVDGLGLAGLGFSGDFSGLTFRELLAGRYCAVGLAGPPVADCMNNEVQPIKQ
jgi:hypothetical protein